jgi:3-methylcrotonyl-CoA carboxylase alpha subunit
MPKEVRKAMTDAATRAARQISYEGAGTIEFIVDGSGPLRTDGFWFMEMNTRLQVEHPVTEAITGQDLVEWQLRVAAGEPLPLAQEELSINGHAFEARIYAEDPQNDFMPAPGILNEIKFGEECRVDTGVCSGDKVSPFYDPMIAKLISHEYDRNSALVLLQKGLAESICIGTQTNLTFLSRLSRDLDFVQARMDTGLIEHHQDSLMSETAPTPFAILSAYLAATGLDPSATRLGWQLWGKTTQEMNLTYHGQEIIGQIQFDGSHEISVNLDDETHVFQNVTHDLGRITSQNNQQNMQSQFLKHGRLVTVKIEGEQFDFETYDPLEFDHNQDVNADSVYAPMTGTVNIVNVANGDRVKKGEPLLALEAMKMEHVMVAPRDGVIAEVYCKMSDAVDEGSQLVTLEEVSE